MLGIADTTPPDADFERLVRMTTTMPEMGKVLESLEKAGLRGSVRVMVGGAPANARFAREIGADGYGRGAAEAAEVAKELVAAAAHDSKDNSTGGRR